MKKHISLGQLSMREHSPTFIPRRLAPPNVVIRSLSRSRWKILDNDKGLIEPIFFGEKILRESRKRGFHSRGILVQSEVFVLPLRRRCVLPAAPDRGSAPSGGCGLTSGGSALRLLLGVLS